jgi:cell division protein FtsW
MGVFGGVLVLALYAVFVYIGWRAAWCAKTRFERLLATGITATIGLQAAMNVAVVTVLTPTTGISLPFISAGGSGLVVFCMATGLLAAIARRASATGNRASFNSLVHSLATGRA